MSERLRREADSGLCRGWMLLPVAERNAIFSDLCLRSRLPDSWPCRVDWGKTPVPAPCLRIWAESLSGREAVNGAWALVLPMLLNLEGRKLVPAGWCEDESGWLYGILELAMRGPKAFDPARKVPFAFFLTRRVIGNCSSRRRRERERTEPLARLAEDVAVVSGSDDIAEDEREVRALFSRLGSDEDDAGLRARVEVALEGGEPAFDEADLREIRRVMFSAR